MWKYVFLVFILVNLCAAEHEVARKKFYHGYHLLYGGALFYYLTFIAIKIKVIFVIGTLIAIALFAGKAFAILKYAALFSDKFKHHDDSVIIGPPPSGHSFSDGHSEVLLDHPPPGYGDYAEHHDHHEHPPDHHDHIEYKSSPYYPHTRYSNEPHKDSYANYKQYARSIGNTLSDHAEIVKDVIKRMDLTEYAFKSMNIDTESCKRLFVCSADVKAKQNAILALGLYVFGDAGFQKYRPKSFISSMEDCQRHYSSCNSI